MLVRSQIAGQKQILWIFGYTEGKNRLILSLGLGGIIQERGVGLKYPFLVGFSPFSAPLVAHCSLVYTLSPPVGRQPEQKGRCLHFLPGGINFQINHRNQMQRHICNVYPYSLNGCRRLGHKFLLFANSFSLSRVEGLPWPFRPPCLRCLGDFFPSLAAFCGDDINAVGGAAPPPIGCRGINCPPALRPRARVSPTDPKSRHTVMFVPHIVHIGVHRKLEMPQKSDPGR